METAALNVPVKGGNVARFELFIDSSYMDVSLSEICCCSRQHFMDIKTQCICKNRYWFLWNGSTKATIASNVHGQHKEDSYIHASRLSICTTYFAVIFTFSLSHYYISTYFKQAFLLCFIFSWGWGAYFAYVISDDRTLHEVKREKMHAKTPPPPFQ